MGYVMGLDNGGTRTKAAIYDYSGREMGSAGCDTPVRYPQPGYAERDLDAVWEANCRVIRGALLDAGLSGDAIDAVAVCGHGKGLYLWGTDNRPAGGGILSTDTRAHDIVKRWRQDGTEALTLERALQHLMACQPPALLAWLQEHRPDVIARTRWIFSCKDYIRFRLTGEARAELTDMSGSGLLNLSTRQYDDVLLERYGLSGLRPALPPLCGSAEIAGTVSAEAAEQCGLKAGTPVAGGMFDIDACALAVNVLDERNICMIAGTWSINEYLRRTPVTDGSVLMHSLFALPDYYLIEESSPTSAGNNEWIIRTLLPALREKVRRSGGSVYEVMNALAASLPPEEFVPIFHPFLMASNTHPHARGSLIGLDISHTRAHLVKSVYEGIVYSHRWHLERLLATRDTPPECIRLAGGAARSEVWTQIFADALQFSIETVPVRETGAFGCAVAAATAIGVYPSLEDAARTMCPAGSRVEPDEKAGAAYEERYRLYRRIVDCLDPLWDEMQACVNPTDI